MHEDALVLGPYELLEEVGRGEIGTVYRARHTETGRVVALKTLAPNPAIALAALERFQRELPALVRLRHPNIVPVEEHGEFRGTRYLVSEWVEGPTLATTTSGPEGRLRRHLRAIVRAARAVHFAHGLGILHRNLQPTNVFVDGKLEPRITDFGLPRPLGRERNPLDTDEGPETPPHYAAPEQLDEASWGVDGRADVFALGAMTYELVTGERPFGDGSADEVQRRILTTDPPPVRERVAELDEDLETILLHAMERSPADRYASAGDLADDLERYLRGRPISARRPSAWTRTVRRWRAEAGRRTVGLGLIAALVALAFVAHVALRGPVGDARAGLASASPEARARALTSLVTAYGRTHPPADELERLSAVLTRGIEDADDRVRQSALQAVVAFGPVLRDWKGEGRTPLEEAILDVIVGEAVEGVRLEALRAAGAMAADAAASTLEALAVDRDESASVSLRATAALGELGRLDAFETLMEVLGRGGAYRRGAFLALDRLTGLQEDPRDRIPEDAPPDRVLLIRPVARPSGTGVERRAALRRTVLPGEEDDRRERDLADLVREGDRHEKLRAIWIFARTRSLQGVPPMLDALGDEDDAVARAAATSLSEYGLGSLRRRLEAQLEAEDPRVRGHAALALGELHHPDSVGAIVRRSHWEEDTHSRALMAEALGALGRAEAVPQLVRLLVDEDREVQSASQRALARIVGEDLGGSPAPWQAWWERR